MPLINSVNIQNCESENPFFILKGDSSVKRMNSLETCREFYNVVTTKFVSEKSRLTFSPDQPSATSNFLFVNTLNEIEIICFKSTYLRIFKESHDYMRKFESSNSTFNLS